MLLAFAVPLLAALVGIHWTLLEEAYGSGPPYYGRTTNMDKWTSPVGALITIDAVAAVLLMFGYLADRKLR